MSMSRKIRNFFFLIIFVQRENIIAGLDTQISGLKKKIATTEGSITEGLVGKEETVFYFIYLYFSNYFFCSQNVAIRMSELAS